MRRFSDQEPEYASVVRWAPGSARGRQMRDHRLTPRFQLVRVEAHPERPRDRRCRIPRDLIFQNPHRADLGTVRAVNETSGSK